MAGSAWGNAFSSSGTPHDPPLTSHGRDQAIELGQHLSVSGLKVDRLLCSPYTRCLQTAEYIIGVTGGEILVEHGLSEWYLPIRAASKGVHPRPGTAAHLSHSFTHINPDAHQSLLYPSRKGESEEALHERAKEILRLIVRQYDEDIYAPRTILIVAHAAVNIALGRALIGERDARIHVGTCSLSAYRRTLEPQDRRTREDAEYFGLGRQDVLGTWTCERNGDCSFLTSGEERDWQFSYVEEYEEEGELDPSYVPSEDDKAPFSLSEGASVHEDAFSVEQALKPKL
ncbi:uncharacterized protein L969DRAFT_90813 [Mixia osmundae IAM 14324]|uniref:uncharacterized protein n=1 Tax=Mixia osmundae (strain CBS 9802 / IAM 14324 / JCM 22182 / KY 12970) TaxID=764103 RepID=UPI0004A550E2|nr:uncharacterized protein L969DRAFT_90813 [Mixia osmundae IAM 14324]KEI36491.1 hypothetical protein L969DRAFT_90813 [Mixia osmundae IAM 14324]